MTTVKLYLHIDDELHTCRVRPFPRKRAPKTVVPVLTDNQLRLFQWLMWDFKATNGPYEMPTMGNGQWVKSLHGLLGERLLEMADRGDIVKYSLIWDGPYSFRAIIKLKDAKEKEATD